MEENKLKNKEEELKESSKETYLNRNTLEVLTNSLDISYYKNLQYDEIVDNSLLGEFDKSGSYIISKDILLELVTVKKIIKESKDGRYILSAPVKSGFSNFIFTLQVVYEKGQNIANLRLVETNIKSDGVKELLKTSIARYKDDDDIYFMTKIKKIFNIIDVEDEGREIDNEEFLAIVLKKFKDFKELKENDEKFESDAKAYIEKVVLILKENKGRLSEYVLKKYEDALEEMKEDIGKPKYYKKLKVKLDNLIDESLKEEKGQDVKPLIADARKEFLESHQKTKKAVFEVKAQPEQSKSVEKKAQVRKSSSAGKKVQKRRSAGKKARVSKPKKKGEKKAITQQIKLIGQEVTGRSPIEIKTPEIDDKKLKEKIASVINGATLAMLAEEKRKDNIIAFEGQGVIKNSRQQSVENQPTLNM